MDIASAESPVPDSVKDVPVTLSVVVPCYNEQECIHELHARLTEVCAAAAGESFEIVLVNDGSKDGTWSLIEALSSTDPHVIGVNLSRNHGHQLALTAGLSIADGQRIFVIDADLQDPPELLLSMMARLDAGADVVFGQRRTRERETLFKRMSASLFYRFLDRLTEFPIPRDTGDFRLVTRRALDTIMTMPEQYRFVRGMFSWIGYRQEPILYDRTGRFAGATKYPFSKMLRLAIDAITGFSIIPLRLASHLGLLLAVLSVPLIIYVMIGWLSGEATAGWTSLTAIVVILGSVQLLVLGLIGEYVGRTFMQSKSRPLFVVQDIVGHVGRQQFARVNRLGFFHGSYPSDCTGQNPGAQESRTLAGSPRKTTETDGTR